MSQIIQNLHDTLTIVGYRSWLVTDQPQLPPRVFCETHVDERGRPFIFEVLFSADVTVAPDAEDEGDDSFQMFLMSMQQPIPLELNALGTAYRLFNVLNTLLPMGTYLINEDDQSIHLKACIPFVGQPSNATVMEVLDMMTLYAQQMAPIIEKVCSGNVSIEEAVAQIKAPQP